MIRPYIMSPELITAIKERIALGRSRAEIEAEVVATGYTTEQYAAAYEAATALPTVPVAPGLVPDTTYYARTTPGTLIATGDLVGQMWDLMKEQKGILGKTIGVALLMALGVALLGGVVFLALGEEAPLFGMFVVGYFVLMTGYGLLYTAMLRAVLRRGTPLTYAEHLMWTLRHFLTLCIVGFMVMGTIVMGYLFLLIPGLMLLIYLSMSVNFVIDERASGLDALVLSTKYIYGRFWPIFIRLFIVGLVIGLISFVMMMLGFFTLFLAPIAFVAAMFVSYYGMGCAWVILYESLLRAGPVKPLPISDSTLRGIYLVAGIVGIVLYIGFTGWSMTDTMNEFNTLFT